MYTLQADTNGKIFLNDEELTPEESQKFFNHSPDGFAWGYHGSGPSQLSLAIMLKITGKSDGYQDLKRNVISKLPMGKPFYITFNI